MILPRAIILIIMFLLSFVLATYAVAACHPKMVCDADGIECVIVMECDL
jgi:hypothetical protein